MRKIPDHQVLDYLLSRCDRSGGPDSCWPWVGVKNNGGYGVYRYHGRSSSAARIVCLLHNGLDPAATPVTRHTCDNPACCNPAHIIPGTYKQNAQDAIERGRRAKQYRPHTRVKKLTADQVRAIRLDTRPLNLIAYEHNISESVVSMVRRRKSKALVPD